MPLFPAAHAASQLRRQTDGMLLYHPERPDRSGYIVPDAARQERLRRSLVHLRWMEYLAWAGIVGVFLLVLIGAEVVLGREASTAEALVPPVIAYIAISMLFASTRQQLSRGLVLHAPSIPPPAWYDRLSGWGTLLVGTVLAIAVGLAFYLDKVWPLKALSHLEGLGAILLGGAPLAKAWPAVGKALAMVGFVGAGLWALVAVVRRRVGGPGRDSGDGTLAAKKSSATDATSDKDRAPG